MTQRIVEDRVAGAIADVREHDHVGLAEGLCVTRGLPQREAGRDHTRDDRRPQLDDFGALGAVKHHADVILGLFREGMYDPQRDIEGATELLVRKNRNGSTGYIDLYFYAQWMRFEDMLDPDR